MNKPFEMNLQLFAASSAETLTTPRDSLPNVYTDVRAREIDFVTRFSDNWNALMALLGIMRPIPKAPGTVLRSYTTKVTLESGSVPAGAIIPYSKTETKQLNMGDVELMKYAKAVPIEDVNKYGAAIAVEKSDDAFLSELQGVVLTDFYTFVNDGYLTRVANSWQMALAKAKGEVINKFNTLRKNITDVVGFANVLDFYDYLGSATISTQTAFGLTYVQGFMGYSTLFLMSAPDVPRGRVIALPVENIDLYYVDPANADFRKLGLEYTVQGVTNLIGINMRGNYTTAVGESHALMGMTLWAEYMDGIAVVDMGTEAFSAVASPAAGANPAALDYYEKDASNAYFHSTDTEVVSGKTYYTRAVTPLS